MLDQANRSSIGGEREEREVVSFGTRRSLYLGSGGLVGEVCSVRRRRKTVVWDVEREMVVGLRRAKALDMVGTMVSEGLEKCEIRKGVAEIKMGRRHEKKGMGLLDVFL